MLLKAWLVPTHHAKWNAYLHQTILKRLRHKRLPRVHGLRDYFRLVPLYEHYMLNIHVREKSKDRLRMSRALTSSMESLTIYRVATTSCLCPILWTRSSACSSAIGLHCGSRRWTRDAAVRSNLATISHCRCWMSMNWKWAKASGRITRLQQIRLRQAECYIDDLFGMSPATFSSARQNDYHRPLQT